MEWLHGHQYCWLMPVSTPTEAATATAVFLRLVWFLQTELFHIIGTNWSHGEMILVPEHSLFRPLPLWYWKTTMLAHSQCGFLYRQEAGKVFKSQRMGRSAVKPSSGPNITVTCMNSRPQWWLPQDLHKTGIITIPSQMGEGLERPYPFLRSCRPLIVAGGGEVMSFSGLATGISFFK